jgi:DNA polymerase-3 subunit delta'
MSFKDIKGQEQGIYALQQDLEQDRLASSYLFLGPQGIGKRKTALTLAKTLNCQETGLDSCDSCSSCLKIDALNHPDIHFTSQTNTDYIKIEEIRQLKKEIGLRPYEGRKKVFIIDNAHRFSAEASNALLKILEEPPGKACIILVSSKFTLLFKTIVSRCRIIRFYPLARSGLAEILKEDYRLDEAAAHFLAYFCEGRLGPSVELKDSDILKEKNQVIDGFTLQARPSMPQAAGERRDMLKKHLNILASWFRDIYMVKVGLPQAEFIHLDRAADLLKAAKRYDFRDLQAIMSFISDSLRYLEENINPKLLLSNLRMELNRA